MRFLSLFSGIEAASTAWLPLGWQCVGVSEIEPFPCALLAQRHPGVPNLGDITLITEDQIKALGHIDLIVFGSPCQDLSVAGKRKGFTNADGDTTRSGLFFTAMRIIGWARKHCGLRFALWENVPGAFSSNAGADFAAVVGYLCGMEAEVPPKGWGTEGAAVGTEGMVEWSVLDAQWAGVAQRRRRVFALADFGDWASRPPILLESESLRGDSAPCREAGQDTTHPVSPCLTASGKGFERAGDIRGQDPVVAVASREVAGSLTSSYGKQPDSSDSALGPNLVIAGVHLHTVQGDVGSDLVSDLRVVQPRSDGLQRPVLTCVSNAEGAKEPVFLTCSNLAKTVNNQTPLLAFNSNAQPDEMKFDPHLSAPLTCSQNSAIAIHPNCIGRAPTAGPQGKEYLTDGSAYTMDSSGQAQAVVIACGCGHQFAGNLSTPCPSCERIRDASVSYPIPHVETMPTLRAGAPSSGGAGHGARSGDCKDDYIVPVCVTGDRTHALKAEGFDASEDGTGRGQPIVTYGIPGNWIGRKPENGGNAIEPMVNVAPCLTGTDRHGISSSMQVRRLTGTDRHGISSSMQVRRLTPRECERLQGFPDDYTLVTVRGKPAADGPRYKALGNSMAVPVMAWIGRQIDFAMLFDMTPAADCEDLFA